MKIIVLMPTKNEEWILEFTLSAASQIADHIIVADQFSVDHTRKICDKNSKVTIIDNNRDGHSNEVRWDLLEEARKIDGKNNLILCIDADEVIPPVFFGQIKDKIGGLKPGSWIVSPWVQIWRSIYTFRNDDSSVWSPKTNKKPFAFIDDRKIEYNKSFVINDHTARIPGPSNSEQILTNIPLLHFQFVNWERSQEKQAWYRCKELLAGASVSGINEKYRNSSNENGLRLKLVPQKWYTDLNISTSIECTENSWYVDEIDKMFKQYGIKKFEGLEILYSKKIKGLVDNACKQ